MAEQLWGWAGGQQAAQQFNQAQEMHQLVVQEGQQKLAMFPLDVQEKELRIKTGTIALEKQQQMLKLLQARQTAEGQPATPTEMAEQLARQQAELSEIALNSGDFGASSKAANAASSLLAHNAKITEMTTKAQIQKHKDIAELLGGATDAKGWDTAKQLFVTLHPDEAKDPDVQKVLQQPYSPGLVKGLQDSIETEVNKANIQAAKARAANSYAQAAEARFRTEKLLPKQVEATDARITHLKKAGAGNLVPKPADINEIVKLAVERIPDAAGDEVQKDRIYNLSREVAAQAKEYEVVDGMARSEAQDKAFQEAWDRKHYAGMSTKGANKIGTTADNPLPVPSPPAEFSSWNSAKQSEWAAKNLKQNMYYITNKGLAVWNGSGFDTPDEGRPAGEPEESDEDTDE